MTKEELINYLQGEGHYDFFVEELKEINPSIYYNLEDEPFVVKDDDIFEIDFKENGIVDYYHNGEKFGHNPLKQWAEDWLINWYRYLENSYKEVENDSIKPEMSIAQIVEEIFNGLEEGLDNLDNNNIYAETETELDKKEDETEDLLQWLKREQKREQREELANLTEVIENVNNSLNWLQKYIDKKEKMVNDNGFEIEYTVLEEYNEVYAIIEPNHREYKLGRVIGKAICTEEDTFSPTIGKALALTRAYNLLTEPQFEEEKEWVQN